LTSSKEGPGVQDFFKKGATVKANTVGATPSLMPVGKLYYARSQKRQVFFFDCPFCRDHWSDTMMMIEPDNILFWTAQNCCINADDFVKLRICDALFGRKICQQS
tara:strand:- start:5702 stop:6016 length:315 start_codon:yes stop_codon:yes gene_type:complete